MLFKMAFRNIKNNFKDYWAFFLSTTFSVFVIYLFMSIMKSKTVYTALKGSKTLISLFEAAAVMTAIFSAFFIWYSNSFFVKSRKKEFAVYMLLGMSKSQTALLDFMENLITMLMAFVSGIVLGILFNKFFIMLLLLMMQKSGYVPFEFSVDAFKFSICIFAAIFVLVSIHSRILIYKDNLIDLLSASKKAEKSLKVSLFTFLIALLSIVFLGYGYYISVKKLGTDFNLAPEVILLVVIGSILFFTGFVSFLIYLSKRNERNLFKGTKLISTSQLSYRYRGNVGTLSVIAITTTIALCAVLSCCSLYAQNVQNSRNMRPFSVEYLNVDNSTDKTFNKILKAHNEVDVLSDDHYEFIKVDSGYKVGNNVIPYFVVKQSDFNKMNSEHSVKARASLKDESSCVCVQMNTAGGLVSKGHDIKFSINGKGYSLKVSDTSTRYFTALDHFTESIVVKDSLYDKIKSMSASEDSYKFTGIMLKDDYKAGKLSDDLGKNMPKESSTLTFYDHYSEGLRLSGLLGFIGIFLGLIFLTATCSIIYFKMITEAKEDRNKFLTLRKIGVSKKEIKSAVSKELSLFFGAPFALAAVSSYAASIPLAHMLDFDVKQQFVIMLVVYAVLYVIYYFITLGSYIKTVCTE